MDSDGPSAGLCRGVMIIGCFIRYVAIRIYIYWFILIDISCHAFGVAAFVCIYVFIFSVRGLSVLLYFLDI